MKFFKLLLLGLLLSVYVPTNSIVAANTISSKEQEYQQNENETIWNQVEFELTSSQYTYGNNVSEYIYGIDIIDTTPNGLISIYFKGRVVAEFRNGVIRYLTGRAPDEWVTWGLQTMENRVRRAISDANGMLPYINVSYNGQVSGCRAYPCHIMSIVDDEV